MWFGTFEEKFIAFNFKAIKFILPKIGVPKHGIKSTVPLGGQSSGGSLQKQCFSGWVWQMWLSAY